MLMSRPPATKRQRVTSIPPGGLKLSPPSPRARICGIYFEADGDFVAIDADDQAAESPTPTSNPVRAGQFWALDVVSIDEATTALPLVVLWGPLR
jgi:hypothetical protein